MRPYQPPQKRHICRRDWGEGVAGFDLAGKVRAVDKINMRWTMTTTTMARGGSKGKVLTAQVLSPFWQEKNS